MTRYATIRRVERLRDYREAELFYNSVKPIRGRMVETRPLGERRYADTYQIIKHVRPEGTEYQAVLYKTACVRFLQNGEIIVTTGGYSTTTTMQFISQVLGIGANRQRGSNVFRISGENYITKDKGELRLRHIGNGQYDIMNENKHFHYVINRTGANNVRKRSARFRDYLKGFISLRTQEVKRYGNTYDMVVVPTSEFAAMFGTITVKDWSGNEVEEVNTAVYRHLTDKKGSTYSAFMRSSQHLDDLITSDDTDNYYKAALLLCARTSTGGMSIKNEMMLSLPTAITEALDESQFKLYSKEVLTLVEVARGKVPNTTYDTWADPTESDSRYEWTKA